MAASDAPEGFPEQLHSPATGGAPVPEGPSAAANDQIAAATPPSSIDLEAIRTNVNDAATVSGGLWVSYLFVLFYLAIGAGAVTHLDLFLEKAIRLPFLSIDLPLVAFFCLAPPLFLIVHAYTLIHFVILAEKAKGFHQALSGSATTSADDWRQRPDNLRRRLPNNVFVQFLAGPPEIRMGLFGLTLRAISWISLAIAPILLLLLIQAQFLPYQSLAVTWLHRVALATDLALLWWLWRRILSGRHVGSRRREAPRSLTTRLATVAGAVASFAIILASVLILSFDDEPQARYVDWPRIFPNRDNPVQPQSLRGYVFHSTVDEISRKRSLPLSNTLILTNVNLPEALGIDDIGKLQNRDFLYRVRGRNFRGAIFDHAIMPKIDFFSAHLEGASFSGADLGGSSFDQAFMSGARLIGAVARSTSYDHADLNAAVLASSNLAGADFSNASLAGASLFSTDISGSKFDGAGLNGADLASSTIFGASFDCADLSHAKLNRSVVSGSFLISAKMDNVDLSGATIDASDFTNARLSHATGKDVKASALFFGGSDGRDVFGAADFKDTFARASADEAQFAQAQIAVFKQNICYLRSGDNHILASEAFKNLGGPDFPALVDYILSPDCAMSASLTAGERDALRTRKRAASVGPTRARTLDCPAR